MSYKRTFENHVKTYNYNYFVISSMKRNWNDQNNVYNWVVIDTSNEHNRAFWCHQILWHLFGDKQVSKSHKIQVPNCHRHGSTFCSLVGTTFFSISHSTSLLINLKPAHGWCLAWQVVSAKPMTWLIDEAKLMCEIILFLGLGKL